MINAPYDRQVRVMSIIFKKYFYVGLHGCRFLHGSFVMREGGGDW